MKAMTRHDLLALPAVIDLETAGRALGIGRTKSFELARAGQWPTPLLTLGGSTYRVPTEHLLRLLGISDPSSPHGVDEPPVPLRAVAR